MSDWKTVKTRRLLAALLQVGWRVKRQTGSHKILERPDWPDAVFAFHDNEEIGPKNAVQGGKGNGFEARRFIKQQKYSCTLRSYKANSRYTNH